MSWAVGGALLLLFLLSTGSLVRSLGFKGVEECPEQTLSAAEAKALYERGLARTQVGMMGEYYRSDSVEAGLPMIRTAALHGVTSAMDTYASHFIQQGAINMHPIDGLSYPDATAEGMMWSILLKHRGETIMKGDEATYQVLLDPSIPFPDGYFKNPSGTAWMFQMVTKRGLDWARKQAFAWKSCW